MARKGSLCKYMREARTNEENNRSVDLPRTAYHGEEFSSVRAMVTNQGGGWAEVLRFP